MFLLLLEEAIPDLRGNVALERDLENPSGRNVNSVVKSHVIKLFSVTLVHSILE